MGLSKITYSGGDTLSAGQMNDIQDAIIDNALAVSSLEQAVIDSDRQMQTTIGETGKYINYNTGATVSNTAGLYNCTDYVYVGGLAQIAYKRTGTTNSSSNIGMAFYDGDKNRIDGVASAVNQSADGYISELFLRVVPKNAVYARFTVFADTTTYGDFELRGVSKISEIKSEIDALHENIANTATVVNNIYINPSSDIFSSTEYAYNVLVIPAQPNARYWVWKTPASCMRLAVGSIAAPSDNDVCTKRVMHTTASGDPLEIDTSDADTYLYVELFTSNDEQSLRTNDVYTDSLVVRKLDTTAEKSYEYALSAYPAGEESGSVVTFCDGAEDIPFKHLTVSMEAEQDFHGYGHPWIGGSGKNLFDPALWVDRSVTGLTSEVQPDGSIHLYGTAATSGYRYNAPNKNILLPAGTYTITGSPNAIRVRTASGSSASGNIDTDGVFTVDGETYVYLGLPVTSGDTYDIYETIQIESGSASTVYEPYENICPISGHTSAKVTRCGKNMLSGWQSVGSNSIGELIHVDFSGNRSYTCSFHGEMAAPKCMFRYYDSNFVYVGRGIGGAVFPKTISANTNIYSAGSGTLAENGVAYVEVRIYERPSDTTEADLNAMKIQFEQGSSETEYEPYQAKTIEVTFPADTGTVYGGTLDVATSQLTVTKAGLVVTERGTALQDNYAWAVYATANRPTNVKIKPGNQSAVSSVVYPYLGTSISMTSMSENGFLCYRHPNNSWFNIYVRYDWLTTAEAWDAYLAALNAAGTPLTFMWELETPLTYSLTPVEITTLLGTNTVFSDAGNISVEYCKDPNHTNVPQIVECGGGHYADANNTRVLFYCVAQNAANKQWQYAQRDTSAAYTEQELDTLQWNDLPSASDSGVLGLLAFATNGMFHYADASILENGDLVRCKVTGGKGAVVYSDPIQLEDLIIEVETAPGTPNA